MNDHRSIRCDHCGELIRALDAYCSSCGASARGVETWTLFIGGQESEVSREELERLVQLGEIGKQARVKERRMPAPLPVGSLPDFKALFISPVLEMSSSPTTEDSRSRSDSSAVTKRGRKSKWRSRRTELLLVGIAVLFFGGLRQVYPSGFIGLIRDGAIRMTASAEQNRIREELVAIVAPVGAAAICEREFDRSLALHNAAGAYNARNSVEMESLTREAENSLRKVDRDLVDRQAYREAVRLLGNDLEDGCSNLPSRLNAGEFDSHSASQSTEDWLGPGHRDW